MDELREVRVSTVIVISVERRFLTDLYPPLRNPTPSGDPLTWEPLTVDKFNYLNISGLGSHPAEDPDPERANFWAKAYET